MPIIEGSIDANTGYFQWGGHGHQYTFRKNNMAERQHAYDAAQKQAAAAYAHGYRGHHQ